MTAEADSGGHTDQRSLPALVPCILDLRDRAAERCPAARDVHVGAAGGIGDPRGLSGALAMGADYVLLGSVHQSTLEAGISAHAKALLAKADMADTAMTAAGDMFESGVKVQVLRKGTMMAVRGNELFDLYRRHDSYEAIPLATRARLEKTVFGRAVEDIWHETRAYHQAQDPAVVARAEREPKYKLGLLFRWYLGKSSRWPVVGDSSRTSDYQIWCGPSMGAFNRWTKGTSLELPENRSVAVVAAALLRGSLQLQRQQLLQSWGLPVSRPLARPMAALPMTG